MREVVTKVYRFDELPDRAKQRALDEHRSVNVDQGAWFSEILDRWTEDLEMKYGFNDPVIRYSGFSSQGDGASFTAKSVTVSLALDEPLKHQITRIEQLMELDASFAVTRGFLPYVHERSCKAYYVGYAASDKHPRINAAIEQATEAIEALRLSLCHKIYRELESEYEYLTSDKAVAEFLTELGYEFTIDGRDYNAIY